MKLQWIKLQQNAAMEEKKRLSYQQIPLTLTEETHYTATRSDQFKRLQQQEMREPVMVMQQHSQSANTNCLPVSTLNLSFPGAAANGGWYPANRSEAGQSNDLNSNLMYQQLQYQQQYQGQVNNSHRMAGVSTPLTIALAASLGLFSGFKSGSSGLDWNTDGSSARFDYNNIVWSLERGLTCPRPSQQYMAASSPYEPMTRMMASGNGKGMEMGVQDPSLVRNRREWTSPFKGKDLFSLSRKFVAPSL